MVESMSMIILGIDPGTARVGWAAIRIKENKVTALSYGCITTREQDSPGVRLLAISNNLTLLLKKYHPDALALEELFFTTNAKTVIPVGEARGVILLAAAYLSIPVVSYSPPAVKLAITGDGTADKLQVGRMIQIILKLKEIPKPDDTTDALAIAMTHAYSYKVKNTYL